MFSICILLPCVSALVSKGLHSSSSTLHSRWPNANSGPDPDPVPAESDNDAVTVDSDNGSSKDSFETLWKEDKADNDSSKESFDTLWKEEKVDRSVSSARKAVGNYIADKSENKLEELMKYFTHATQVVSHGKFDMGKFQTTNVMPGKDWGGLEDAKRGSLEVEAERGQGNKVVIRERVEQNKGSIPVKTVFTIGDNDKITRVEQWEGECQHCKGWKERFSDG